MCPIEIETAEKSKPKPEQLVDEINASAKTSGDTHISDSPQLNGDEVAIGEPESQDVVRARRKYVSHRIYLSWWMVQRD